MKNKTLIYLGALLFILGCAQEDKDIFLEGETPQSLEIMAPTGIKLQDIFVSNKVAINVKLPTDGEYFIRIIDITGKTVSQEKITANKGDNILNAYTTALEKSSYQIMVIDSNNKLIGIENFVMIN
jgi:hypothetical protein